MYFTLYKKYCWAEQFLTVLFDPNELAKQV